MDLNRSLTLCYAVRVEILTLVVTHPFMNGYLPFLGPAYDVALEKIKVLYPNLHVTQTLLTDERSRDCDSLSADSVDRHAAYLYDKSLDMRQDPCTVTAMIFAGCIAEFEVMQFTAGLDILMLTSFANAPALRNKDISPTWVTLSYISATTMIRMYVNLANKLERESLAIIIDEGSSDQGFVLFGKFLMSALMKQHFNVYSAPYNGTEVVDYRAVLLRLSSFSRTFLYFGDPPKFRPLLLAASELNFTQGEHIFVVSLPYQLYKGGAYLYWKVGDKDDEVAKTAYRSVLIMESDIDDSDRFDEEMRNRSQSAYNFTYGKHQWVSTHPVSAYAGLLAFAEVIEELRLSGQQNVWSSGRSLAQRFLNRTFKTDISDVYIDSVGERIPKLHISQLDWNTSFARIIFKQRPSTLQLESAEPVQWPVAWPPPSQPKCGFRGDDPVCDNTRFITILALVTATAILVVILLSVGGAIILKRRAKHIPFSRNLSWFMEPVSLQPLEGNRPNAMLYLKEQRTVWVSKIGPVHSSDERSPQFSLNQSALRLLQTLSTLHADHRNINRLVGMSMMNHFWYFISDYCTRGSLCDLLSKMHLDFDLQTAIIFDALQGVQAIHRSSLKHHGNLSSSCCLIDKYFTLKIGEVGFSQIRHLILNERTDKGDPGGYQTAVSSDDMPATAVILCQIILLEVTPRSVDDIRSLFSNNIDSVPSVFSEVCPDLLLCTDRVPENRPSIDYMTKCFVNALPLHVGEGLNLVERMMRRVETYIAELDRQVAVRTQALLDERKKCDFLLREMFPSLIVEQLRTGLVADAEMFESATIMFTEIGGFISILEREKASRAMMFLNDVYSAFDSVLHRHDVFKVETIKDSYMVVSGLPKRNENLHAKEICALAVSLFKAYSPFQPIFDNTSLRAGIHSGPCAAGVVGHKTPRYCLFGDTVNTAARMLSHGADARVHLSQSTAELLDAFPDFKVKKRGVTDIKGKGKMSTFWLILS